MYFHFFSKLFICHPRLPFRIIPFQKIFFELNKISFCQILCFDLRCQSWVHDCFMLFAIPRWDNYFFINLDNYFGPFWYHFWTICQMVPDLRWNFQLNRWNTKFTVLSCHCVNIKTLKSLQIFWININFDFISRRINALICFCHLLQKWSFYWIN